MSKRIVIMISIALFLLPFLWFSPSELEMGGDSNRLFLYDPNMYFEVNALYSINPDGMGEVRPDQVLIPFLLLLKALYGLFRSPYLLMTLLNSGKLVGSFVFMYVFVLEILTRTMPDRGKGAARDLSAILAGLWYTFAPSVGENMRSALITHNQVFLNPMMAYFILRLFVTHRAMYLWFMLLTSLVFAPNFSLKAPPPPFAFYPLVIVFLMILTTRVLKKHLPWKLMAIGAVFFVGLHAFHLVPVTAHIFDTGSDYNVRAFGTGTARNESLAYFEAIRGLGKVWKQFLLIYEPSGGIAWLSWAAPLVIILGFLVPGRKHFGFLLTAVLFLLTVYLSAANITQLGIAAYRMLYAIPGFSMFRVFYGQWQWVHGFSFALLFGYSGYLCFVRMKKGGIVVVTALVLVSILISSWTFVSGALFRLVHPGSKGMTSVVTMNPDFERALSSIKQLPDDAKIFNLPFTDYFYQVVPGVNNAAYIGLSPISYLAGKKSFSGYQTLYPFPEVFLKLAKEKNYAAIQRLFALLNVKFIFYLADPKAFLDYYPSFPYSLFADSVPTSEALASLASQLGERKVFQQGNMTILEVSEENFLPHIWAPPLVVPYDSIRSDGEKNVAFFVGSEARDPRVGYLARERCGQLFSPQRCGQKGVSFADAIPIIGFQRMNPTKYRVRIARASKPFILVFSEQFHKDWKLFLSQKSSQPMPILRTYFDGAIGEGAHQNIFLNGRTFETLRMKAVPEENHFVINGYANAWIIDPAAVGNGGREFELTLEMTQQRYAYVGLGISIATAFLFLGYGAVLFRRDMI